ncbi:hypothetical protein AALO_G00138600 [Alosa alosa]|uniref:Uncharacterized protein n=1 Tax=Alosa alosa TaxID=278164 RepID=A0AAV6GHR7_9TELE|nr:hypothetical protein AALO_G00138600 [Alosa alosa]
MEAEVNQHKQKKGTVRPAQSPVSEEEQLESYESEEEVDYDYQEEMLVTTYPPVTVVHEIPQTDLRPSSGEENLNASPGESSLRPEAELHTVGCPPDSCLHRGIPCALLASCSLCMHPVTFLDCCRLLNMGLIADLS